MASTTPFPVASPRRLATDAAPDVARRLSGTDVVLTLLKRDAEFSLDAQTMKPLAQSGMSWADSLPR